MELPVARLRNVPTWLAVGVLALVAGVLPVVIAHRYGALGIPRNDDWSYALATFRLGDSGRFDLNGWAAVNVVGQMLPGVPLVWIFGRRFTPLQLEVVVVGLLGLVALFQLGAMLVSRTRALFTALLVALFPLWAPLAVSFMTDVPAFALEMVALAVGAWALRPARPGVADRIRPLAYAAALGASFLGYTIRENAIVPFIALTIVGAWCAWPGTRRDRTVVATGLVAWLVALGLFVLWRRGAAGYQDPSFMVEIDHARDALRRVVQLLPPAGIALVPLVVLAGPVRAIRSSVRRAPRLAALIAMGGGILGALTITWHRPFGTGNYVDPRGVLGADALPGVRPELLPDVVVAGLAAVGIASLTVAAVAFVRPALDQWAALRARGFGPPTDPTPALVALAALGFGGFVVASGVMGNAVWDRYLLPIIPLVGLLLLRTSRAAASVPSAADLPVPPTERARRIGAAVALAAVGAFGLVLTVNSASFDGARWAVATEAARAVGRAEHVRGGFEWDDYHAGRDVYFTHVAPRPSCVRVAAEVRRPRSGDPAVVASLGVWTPGGDRSWVVAHRTGDCDA